jgi:hypothetical protein
MLPDPTQAGYAAECRRMQDEWFARLPDEEAWAILGPAAERLPQAGPVHRERGIPVAVAVRRVGKGRAA